MALAAASFLDESVGNNQGCTLMRDSEHLGVIKEMVLALLDEVKSLAEIQVSAPGAADDEQDFYEMVMEYEKFLIRRALLRARGNQARAAQMLRLKPTTLYNKIKAYHINAARPSPECGDGLLAADCPELRFQCHRPSP